MANETEGAEQTLRDFLMLPLRASRRADFLAEPLATYSRLLQEVHPSARVVREEAQIHALSVEHIDRGEARALVDAIVEVEFEQPDRTTSVMTLDCSGPARLIRTGSGWKVADYQRDGRATLDTVILLDNVSANHGELVLALRALDLERPITTAVFEARNAGLEAIELESAALFVSRLLLRRWKVRKFTGETLIPAERRVVTAVGWPIGLSPSTRQLRLAVRCRAPRGADFVISFHVKLPTLDKRRYA